MAEQKRSLFRVLKQAFSGYNPTDKDNHAIPLQSGNGRMLMDHPLLMGPDAESGKNAVVGDTDWISEKKMPQDRFVKYGLIQEMLSDPVLSAALDMHIAHALSVDSRTGNILTIEATTPEFADMAASLMADLGPMINANAPAWCKIMASFGVHYIRPYTEPRRGIVDIESSYYTMPQHVREYVRGGQTAGFTSEYLKQRTDGGDIKLVEPWTLVALRIPYWQPNVNIEPLNPSGVQYSLYDDLHRRVPVETQNYGTSFLEFAYPAWCDLTEAIKSLRGSRYNASRIDRFVALGMDNLDPARAAQYLSLVGSQMRKDMEALARKSKARGIIPTIMNQIIPVLSGTKGGVTVDTQMVSPDIQHIEDVMFHLKRMCGAIGIDASMLGWGDLISGGLGEGGWFRSAVQSALRANWIRHGLSESVNRLIDIHMAYKYARVFPTGELRPIKIRYHSLNTAIEAEEAEATETRTNYALSLATLLDTVENGRLSGSNSFKELVLTDIIRIDPERAKQIIKELAKAAETEAASQEGGFMESFMESVGYRGDKSGFQGYLETMIHQQIINLVGDPS